MHVFNYLWFYAKRLTDSNMIYRELGNTGLKLSILSFGASSLGGVFREIDEGQAIETVHASIEGGINFIDVSPYYGHYRAEKVLGRALNSIPRDRYHLSTKVGRYGENGINLWDYSAKRALESVDESMDRLNIDYIDLINVHDIEFSDLDQVVNETIPALTDLKKAGKVGFIGITGLPLSNFSKVIDRLAPGTIHSVLSFCHYTLQDTTLLDHLDYFKKNHIGVINASPISMGLLSERGVPSWHPASDQLVETCIKAVDHCRRNNFRIEQLAIRFCVEHPGITTTLVGTANPENIRKNIAWVHEELNEDLLAEVQHILEPVMNETWENS